jgi:hypothetical protein
VTVMVSPCGWRGAEGHRAGADPGAAFLGYLGSRIRGQPQVTTRP